MRKIHQLAKTHVAIFVERTLQSVNVTFRKQPQIGLARRHNIPTGAVTVNGNRPFPPNASISNGSPRHSA
jgi:hypothetical protein